MVLPIPLFQFGFAPVLLENIENAVKVVARGLKENILSSNLEYSGNNAIGELQPSI